MSFFILLFMAGCSSPKLSWKRAQQSAYDAAVDPVTWVPAFGTVVLYSTQYDSDVTHYFMEHKPIHCIQFTSTNCAERANTYRLFNSVITLSTAAFVNDEGNVTKKLKRIVVEQSNYMVDKSITDTLEDAGKKSPDRKGRAALGSHHALEPFAGSAMTRRNVSQMNIPLYAKYSIIGTSYYFSTYSALTRVQDGAHSLGDQFLNMAVGNFLGLFVHDLFMVEESVEFQVLPVHERLSLYVNYHF